MHTNIIQDDIDMIRSVPINYTDLINDPGMY